MKKISVIILAIFTIIGLTGGVAGFDLGRSCHAFCKVNATGKPAPDASDLSLCVAAACDFRGTDLSGMDLGNKDLRGIDFKNADLRDASFRNSDLAHANFHAADVRGADFTGARLTGTNLGGAIFCKTRMPGVINDRDCGKG